MKDINDLINGIKGQDELMSLDEAKGITGESAPLTSNYKTLGIVLVTALIVLCSTLWLWPSAIKNLNNSNVDLPREQSNITDNSKINADKEPIIALDKSEEYLVSNENITRPEVIEKKASDEKKSHSSKIEYEEEITPSTNLSYTNSEDLLLNTENVEVSKNRVVLGGNDDLIKSKSVVSEIASLEVETKLPRGSHFEGRQNDLVHRVETSKTLIKQTQLSELDSFKSLADLLGAVYLSPLQLKKLNLYVYDDVQLFSSGDKDNYFEISITTNHGNTFSRSGNKMKWGRFFPVAALSKNAIYFGDENLEKLEKNSSDYFSVLAPFEADNQQFILWYFEKKKSTTNLLKDVIALESYTSSNIDYYEDRPITQMRTKPIVKKAAKLYDEHQLIRADKTLLEKLKIDTNNNTIIYQCNPNSTENNSIILRKNWTESTYGNNKVFPSPNDYPPAFFTLKSKSTAALDINEFVSKNDEKKNSEQYFMANKHHMIAISIQQPRIGEVVFWYEDAENILKLVSEYERNRIEQYLSSAASIKNTEISALPEDNSSILSKMTEAKQEQDLVLNPIRLSKADLAKLNIYVDYNSINYSQFYNNSLLTLKLGKRYTEAEYVKDTIISSKKTPKPIHVSDKFGKSYRLSIYSNKTAYDLNTLIPIYVKSNEEYHFTDYLMKRWRPDCIFWYEPTDEFLALLPQDIRRQLTYELALISDATQIPSQLTTENTNDSTSEIESCVYLDPCADIKTNITDMVLFPNPTKGIVNVSISLSKSVGGDIKVTNLTGQPFLEKRLEDCSVQSTLDVSHLPAGLYLVTLLSDDGDKITRRVIRE